MDKYSVFDEVVYSKTEREWSITVNGKTRSFKNLFGSLVFGNLGEVSDQAEHAVTVHAKTDDDKLVVIHEFKTEDSSKLIEELIDIKDAMRMDRIYFLPSDEALLRDVKRADGLTYYDSTGISAQDSPVYRRNPGTWKFWRSWNLTAGLTQFHPHLQVSESAVLKSAKRAFQEQKALVLPHCRNILRLQGKRWSDAKNIPLILSVGFGVATGLMLIDEEKRIERIEQKNWREPYPSRWGGLT